MATMTSYAPGTFCWADLAAPKQEEAKKFYSEVFGWTSIDYPMGPDSVYSMMQKNGQNVAAIATMQPDQQSSGMPAFWNSYISVPNVDQAVGRAESLGATAVSPVMDVMEEGRMAVIKDPTGAHFSLWEAKNHKGAAVVGDPGSLAWFELLTKDTASAKTFYTDLLGWSIKSEQMPGMDYTVFKNGSTEAGGMFAIDPSWGPVPPNWMVYLGVENCDASCEKITSLGGKVLMGPTDVPGVGRFATCQDPQGGSFAVIAPNRA